MLTIAAVGGFAVPAVFGQIVPHSGYAVGWLFLGIVTAATALIGLAGRNSGQNTSAPTSIERPATVLNAATRRPHRSRAESR
jgi:hypothetical protein